MLNIYRPCAVHSASEVESVAHLPTSLRDLLSCSETHRWKCNYMSAILKIMQPKLPDTNKNVWQVTATINIICDFAIHISKTMYLHSKLHNLFWPLILNAIHPQLLVTNEETKSAHQVFVMCKHKWTFSTSCHLNIQFHFPPVHISLQTRGSYR